jgi:hypothetical protein
VTSVKHVADIMNEITAASSEQSNGIEEVNRAITQMDEMTQQNAALVEEAAAAAQSMQDQASTLGRAVSVFKMEGAASSISATPSLTVAHAVTAAAPPATVSDRTPAPVRRAATRTPAVAEPSRAKAIRHAADNDWEEF